MLKIYVCKGLPGCGKSTFAKELMGLSGNENLHEINRDDIRKGHPKYVRGKLSKVIEKYALEEVSRLVKYYLEDCKASIISSDTNLSPSRMKYWEGVAKKYKAKLEIIDFTDPSSEHYVSLENCLKRDLLRNDSVGKDVILKMWYSILVPEEKIPVELSEALDPACIVDLDGTLAHYEGIRGCFEDSKYDLDDVDEAVLTIINSLKATGFKIIVLSGREGTSIGHQKTLSWLQKHNVPFDEFEMRKIGDRRKDYIIKREIYEAKFKFRYDVKFVFDDRPSVCREWEKMGLKVLRCGPGMEF